MPALKGRPKFISPLRGASVVCDYEINIAAPSPQANLRIRFLSAVAGRDHSRCAGWARCLRIVADRRREVPLFSVAGISAGRIDGGGVAVDLVNEGSGGCTSGQ